MQTTDSKNIFSRFMEETKAIFISGLLTLLPLTLTIALFSFTFKLIKSWSQPIYVLMPEPLRSIPNSSLLVMLITILIVGCILRYLLLHPLVEFIENNILGKIPLVKQVYFGIKQLVKILYPSDVIENDVQKVVLVEFPRPGVYCIGLVTGITPLEMFAETSHVQIPVYYNVFVPTTPNPTTGFFFMVSEADCKPTNLTRQEAMALVISGGIIQPERFEKPLMKI